MSGIPLPGGLFVLPDGSAFRSSNSTIQLEAIFILTAEAIVYFVSGS